MTIELAEETDFNPIVWTWEEYQIALQEEKEQTENSLRAARNAIFFIRCSAWICLVMAVISIVILNNSVSTFFNLAMAITNIAILKVGDWL